MSLDELEAKLKTLLDRGIEAVGDHLSDAVHQAALTQFKQRTGRMAQSIAAHKDPERVGSFGLSYPKFLELKIRPFILPTVEHELPNSRVILRDVFSRGI